MATVSPYRNKDRGTRRLTGSGSETAVVTFLRDLWRSIRGEATQFTSSETDAVALRLADAQRRLRRLEIEARLQARRKARNHG